MYFSGFGFENESELFESYIDESLFCVSGFSLGAIKAFEYTLANTQRVKKLQLFSPAFFQDKEEGFKQKQLTIFNKNRVIYMNSFYKNISKDYSFEKYLSSVDEESLKLLLYYEWDEKKLRRLMEQKIDIEVFLGMEDKIIDSRVVSDFFSRFAVVYEIKGKGHALV